jgi:hypothetical protein
MCTLCLSDMGELRDEWLREPKKAPAPAGATDAAAMPPSAQAVSLAAPRSSPSVRSAARDAVSA